MKSEERQILKGLRNKQTKEAAFVQLMNLYKKPLYAHVRSMTGNHPDADDSLQNAFVKVWKHIDGFKGDSALYTWLYRITTNEALTIINKRSKMQVVDMEESHHSGGQNDGPDGDEIRKKLDEAIEKLPAKQRKVFEMKYFSEMKYIEMAELTGTSVGALKASYFHAVRKIEDYLTSD
ncbi:MAG: RNA polymerase sigma factor (sigma-70 family) [Cryomorphaceae bacterium]|jgi:RNA polymerase sigma-70 factor (ECF subfamily)